MVEKILEVNNLHYYYGDIHAVKGVSFHVDNGEIVALIGANGAGKTTILRNISGLLGNIRHGEIIYFGQFLNKIQPHVIASKGLCQVLEGRHIYPQLTVKENILMGAFLRKDKLVKEDVKKMYEMFPVLKERQNQTGGTLSGGEQQMLAIARVLINKPKLILMDEPSLGLAPLIVKEVFEVIKTINNEGISILLVEQNSKAALGIANRGYVIETGEIVIKGKSVDLLNNEEVKKSYMGG